MFEEEYELEFFKETGYMRKVCASCGGGFWTLDEKETLCGDTPCVEYSFIGNSPMNRVYSIDEVRETYLMFFENRGHTRFKRYPVMARWRDDVFLTNASIYAFQPFVTSGLIPPPHNPLTMSQPCIRMIDLDSVGKTGKHLSSFEMMAHHAFNSDEEEIYWKDETVRLCHEQLTKTFGIEDRGIIYKEKPWFGGGNAGPSLEVQVGGLELATLVFMNLKRDDAGDIAIEGEKYSPNPLRIVDTGYGLERYVWSSMATPTIYDAVYPDLTKELFEASGISHELEDERYASIIAEHARLAGIMDIGTTTKLQDLRAQCVKRLADKGLTITIKELNEIMIPLEKVYAIVDHTRTLAFMLTDRIVPSNTKAGYLARLVIRRTLRFMEGLSLDYSLSDLVLRQISRFDNILNTDLNDIIENMLGLETERYHETKSKGKRLITTFLSSVGETKEIPTDALIEFYDTHGIHPREVQSIAKDMGKDIEIPDAFNSILAAHHQSPEKEEEKVEREYTLPPTKLLYYDLSDPRECDATVIYSEIDRVVLDRTVYYPEGGGQPSDQGVLITSTGEVNVIGVQRFGDVIVHLLDGTVPKGEIVHCIVDWDRRMTLTRHQSGTHVILGSARQVLGGHVWQSGAQKGLDSSRVDITHFKKIDDEDIRQIELVANKMVLAGIPIEKVWMDRGEAEKLYGFRLYQGGVPVGKKIRVVRIGDFDVEACAGTHVKTTNELGLIKILKTERIQDGIGRITFAAGMSAVDYVQKQTVLLSEASEVISVFPEQLPKSVKRFFEEWKSQKKQIEKLRRYDTPTAVNVLLKEAEAKGEIIANIRIITQIKKDADKFDYEELMSLGRNIYNRQKIIAILACDFQGAKLILARSMDVNIDCADLAREVGAFIGGGGGGKPEFAQAGGKNSTGLDKAVAEIKKKLKEQL